MIAIDVRTFDKSKGPEELVVTLDQEGLKSLIAQLQFLASGKTEHLDLMSDAWGGTHLHGVSQAPGDYPIQYLKVYLRDLA